MKKKIGQLFVQRFLEKKSERRGFLGLMAKGLLFVSTLSVPGLRPEPAVARGNSIILSATGKRTLLKNGLIVDGTKKKGFNGSVLINGDTIEKVFEGGFDVRADVIDCTGKVISPGIIDMHSHMDWVLPIEGHAEMKNPFTAQGVTTFVAGNCGFGIAGFREDTLYMENIHRFVRDLYSIEWSTMDEYFAHLKKVGMSHNLVNLAGHGTTRASLRGFDPSPLSNDEMSEVLMLLTEAMDQGAYGVSFGLQYEPGIFATLDEINEIARLVKEKDKVITVHMKAYSTLSGTYPLKLFGTPHNLLGIEDMLQVGRETGVKLQLSHLIFVGSLTWKNYEKAFGLIDEAISDGVDVSFDTYSYHCGTSIINVFLPEWFLAEVPEAFEDRSKLRKLKRQISLMEKLLGFGYKDIQITDANHEELNKYNGMFIYDIAKERGMGQFENFIDIAKKSKGLARVLNHRYSNMEIVEEMMKHPASLFMTDATPTTSGIQNPGCYGCFPRFFEIARDKGIITIEEAVYKMSGAAKERFDIKDRGILKEGLKADILVFDWESIKDNNTITETDTPPTGIEAVFINGRQVQDKGKVDGSITAGVVV